jgi:putative redox protein
VKVNAKRRKGYAHSLTAGRHALIVDEPEEKGGADMGAMPSQLLALSLAACTAITIEMYADRKGWEVGAVEVEVEYEPAPREHRARFDVTIKLPDTLPEDQVASLIQIAAKCPVHRMLKGGVEISDRVERVSS